MRRQGSGSGAASMAAWMRPGATEPACASPDRLECPLAGRGPAQGLRWAPSAAWDLDRGRFLAPSGWGPGPRSLAAGHAARSTRLPFHPSTWPHSSASSTASPRSMKTSNLIPAPTYETSRIIRYCPKTWPATPINGNGPAQHSWARPTSQPRNVRRYRRRTGRLQSRH